jgi:hypothetical protein
MAKWWTFSASIITDPLHMSCFYLWFSHVFWFPSSFASLCFAISVPIYIDQHCELHFPITWWFLKGFFLRFDSPVLAPFQCFLLLISFPIIQCASTLSTYLSIVLLFFRPISFVLIHVIYPLLLLSRLVSFYFA